MARNKIEERNTRKIQHSSGSYYLSLPIEFVRALKWKDRQKVVVHKSGKKLIIEDWRK